MKLHTREAKANICAALTGVLVSDPLPDVAAQLIVCPSCKADLDTLANCGACGTEFRESHRPPSLIPRFATREVTFCFPSDRSTAGTDFEKVFRYPEDLTEIASLPYHLDPAHAAVLDALPRGSMVLEIGCGGGQMRKHLRAKGISYIGTDISVHRVGSDLCGHGGPDLLCDAHFLPFRDEQFDFIYTSAVVEHLACPQAAAQEIQRVLKGGGLFVGSVSFLEPWHDDSFYHMTPLGVFEWLTQAGFAPEYIWPGRNYSGYDAMMIMGNKATARARVLGRFSSAIYRNGNRIRNLIRKLPNSISDDAKIAGSTDWIARKEGSRK